MFYHMMNFRKYWIISLNSIITEIFTYQTLFRYHWSFVFDPAGRLCYYWSLVVSIAFLYNFWVIIFRFSFAEIDENSILYWFCLDYFMDLIYILDVLFHFRTGYLEVNKKAMKFNGWNINLRILNLILINISANKIHNNFTTIGWCTADRLYKIASTLHEFDNVLCGRTVFITTGLSIPLFRIQINSKNISAGQSVPVLGIYGSHRAAYKLSKPFQILFINSLSSRCLSLECVCLSLAPLPQGIWGCCLWRQWIH